jgi:hypothetical protein
MRSAQAFAGYYIWASGRILQGQLVNWPIDRAISLLNMVFSSFRACLLATATRIIVALRYIETGNHQPT